MIGLADLIDDSITDSVATHDRLRALAPQIARAAEQLVTCYRAGGKALLFGNGGSAADAQHLAAELECRFAFDRPPLAALALHANTSALTAIANDYSYDQVYARLVRAHARPGDIAIALSTSGKSPNVIAAARTARELGLGVIALTGEEPSLLAEHATVVIAVPSRVTARIQECHILVGHLLCQWLERSLFEGPRG